MMARLVIDASIALRWFLEDEDTAEADDLFDNMLNGQDEVLIPPHLRAECFNGLTRIVFREPHRLTSAAAQERLAMLDALPLVVAEPAGLYERSLDEVTRHNLHPSMAYDMIYLVLAQILGVPLWTGDARFYHAIRPAPSWVLLLPSTRTPSDP